MCSVQWPPQISSNKQQTWKNKSAPPSPSLTPSLGTREGIQRMLPVTIKLLDIASQTHTRTHTHKTHSAIQTRNRMGGIVPQGGITSSIAPHTPFIYRLMRSRYIHTQTRTHLETDKHTHAYAYALKKLHEYTHLLRTMVSSVSVPLLNYGPLLTSLCTPLDLPVCACARVCVPVCCAYVLCTCARGVHRRKALNVQSLSSVWSAVTLHALMSVHM